jgi:hypothetical protein
MSVCDLASATKPSARLSSNYVYQFFTISRASSRFVKNRCSKSQTKAVNVMLPSLFWEVTQRRLIVIYRRFWTTYQSHLQWSSSPRRTSVTNYQSALRNKPEQRRSHSNCDGSLKSRSVMLYFIRPIWLTFGTGDVYNNVLRDCEFRENRCSESRILGGAKGFQYAHKAAARLFSPPNRRGPLCGPLIHRVFPRG